MFRLRMRPKMFRQPRARCLKVFLFLTGSVIILLWNYHNPQGLSGQSTLPKNASGNRDDQVVAPEPKKHQTLASAHDNKKSAVNAGKKITSVVGKHKTLDDGQKKHKTGLVAERNSFYLDGKPITLLSGSFHYFRTLPQLWSDRLAKMRAAGLNTVTTYIPWNLHEPLRDRYEFSGMFNIAEFIKLVQRHNLHLIIRPGPYICAEWELGGFPYWLLQDPNMKFRTSTYKPYLSAVEKYFNTLLPIFVPFMYKNGGPIIAFQIENEFGSWGPDRDYMTFLHKLYVTNGLDKELLLTSDGSPYLRKGKIDGVLTTVNFNEHPEKKLKALKELQPDKPMMVMEFWPGWFDRWNEKHHIMSTTALKDTITTVLSLNASINFYMFVGGTHFDFWNGASNISRKYGAIVTSYDYDAPIGEAGDTGEKYIMLRKLFSSFNLTPRELPPIPKNSPKEVYKTTSVSDYLDFDQLLSFVSKQHYKYPKNMENIYINQGNGQGYGWILYRTKFPKPKGKIVLTGLIHDRAQVMFNGKFINTFEFKSGTYELHIPARDIRDKANTLDVFVENMGRVNWDKPINIQRKGLLGNVTVNNVPMTSWVHAPFEFCDSLKKNMSASKNWKSMSGFQDASKPTAFRVFIDVKGKPKDTFMNMEKWGRGLVLVNGFNIGRYWSVGPQRTLYVPSPLLKTGKNEIIIFELHKPDMQIKFSKEPLLSLESQQLKESKN